jgi:uncharacterized membrane protein
MQCENRVVIAAPVADLYRFAAVVELWPGMLPHYRWVKVLGETPNGRLVEMAARRDRIPVWWRAEQRLFPEEPRITFRHVEGVTTGMEVEWAFAVEPDGRALVTISHELVPRIPIVGRLVADRVIGPYFVHHIAGLTLARLKELAEAGKLPGNDPAEFESSQLDARRVVSAG